MGQQSEMGCLRGGKEISPEISALGVLRFGAKQYFLFPDSVSPFGMQAVFWDAG